MIAFVAVIAALAFEMRSTHPHSRHGEPARVGRSLQASDRVQTTFDATRLDVSGLRVGGRAKDFEATAQRLYGPVIRLARSPAWFAGYASALQVNPVQCTHAADHTPRGNPGAACITAYLDAADVVRGIRIERVFAFMDAATFRTTLVRRYGDANAENDHARWSLGWGPQLDPALAYDAAGPLNALTAHYSDDVRPNAARNGAHRIRITLQLVDAAWVTTPR